MKPQKIDTSMAEKWLTPDTFVYKGKTYRVSGGYWTRGECSPLIVQEIKKEGHKMEVIPKCYRVWFKDGTAMLVDANSIAEAKEKTLMPEDVRKVECLD